MKDCECDICRYGADGAARIAQLQAELAKWRKALRDRLGSEEVPLLRERDAALEQVEGIRADEREACAKMLEAGRCANAVDCENETCLTLTSMAAAIRAGGKL